MDRVEIVPEVNHAGHVCMSPTPNPKKVEEEEL